MFRKLMLLALVILWIGCDADSSDEKSSDSQSSENVAQGAASATVAKVPFQRTSSAEENEALAREWADQIRAGLDAGLAELKTQLESAESESDQAALYARLNPVPQYIAAVEKMIGEFPECSATFEAALAGLGYAGDEQRGPFLTYLINQWPNRLDHRKIVEYLLSQVPEQQVEDWFHKIIEASPEGLARAEALMGFSTYFSRKPVFAKMLRYNEQVAAKLPDEQLQYIFADRTESQTAALTRYLTAIIDEYGDLKYSGSGMGGARTYGEMASRQLFDVQNLNVGDVAPDIVGHDLDGTPFKLSDYRGKVVMLDFWGQWCPPCRRMYPYERELVRRLSGMPFALIGVNSDSELETAQASVKDEKLPWRNFWNGPGGTSGPISTLYNVTEWPTVYLIDGDGVIRYRAPLGNEIEQGIEVLLGEQGIEIDLDPVEVASR